MKNLTLFLTTFFVIAAIMVTGCQTPQQKMVETEKAELKAKMTALQDSLKEEYGDLQSMATEELDEMQKQQLAKFKAVQETLNAKLEKIETATPEDWEAIKGETVTFLNSLQEKLMTEPEEEAEETE